MKRPDNSIVLRFCDFAYQNFIIDTISEHKKICEEYNFVYWGLWKKPYEDLLFDDRRSIWLYNKFGEENGSFSTPCTVFLCNISAQKVYKAICNDILNEKNIEDTHTSFFPKYYNNLQKPQIYFGLCSIEELNYNEFYNSYSEKTIFSSDDTIFINQQKDNIFPNEYITIHHNSILHISDLHFGSNFNYHDGTPGRRRLPTLKEKFECIKSKYKIGLIVASGDFSYGKDRKNRKDYKANFDKAKNFLNELCLYFDLDPTKHLLLVPGNHDKGFVEDHNQESPTIDPINSKANNDYDQEYRDFQKQLINEVQLTYVRRFSFPEDLKVHFVCLDSSDLQSKQTREYGYIDKRQFEIIRTIPCDKKSINFAVMHHPLILPPAISKVGSYKDESGKFHAEAQSILENSFDVAKKLAEQKFKYILHGHQHYPYFGKYVMRDTSTKREISIRFFSAGTLGLDNQNTYPDFPFNSFNVYTISKKLSIEVYKFLPHEAPKVHDSFWVNL